MRITYDPDAGALYIELRYVEAVDSIGIEPGVTADVDADGHIIGLEVLDASERLGCDPLTHLSVERLEGGLVAADAFDDA
jgi:uncharacterized protein YuzE